MAVSYPTPLIYGQSSSLNVNARTLKTEFGDGYQSVVADGINNIVRTGTIVHPMLPKVTNSQTIGADALRTFLKANMSGQVVTIQNKMEDPTGGTDINVYLEGYQERYDGQTYTFSVTFREAFSS